MTYAVHQQEQIMTNTRTVYVVRASRKQHSTWFKFEDAIRCMRILYKRGRSTLSVEVVTLF